MNLTVARQLPTSFPSLSLYLSLSLSLQSYGRVYEQGKVLQTFVQSVAPGSPAFMAGLYPGDAIIEVDGENVRYAPVEDVVGKIMDVPRNRKEK